MSAAAMRAIPAMLTMLLCAFGGASTSTAAAQRAPGDGDLVVRDAWVRTTTAARTTSSGYLTVENRTGRPIALVRVAAKGVGSIAMHTVVEAGGQATMQPLARAEVPALGSLRFAPGGAHLMLLDVTPPLPVGATLEMILTFDNRQTRTIRAVVRPLDATGAR
jgi:copper(I)-binding protein